MYRTLTVLLTLYGFLLGNVSHAMNSGSDVDDIRFSYVGLKEGLSHSTVFDINQDRNGYMWFATSDGVNKFDGYNLRVYRHEYTNPASIASDLTRCIAIDGQNRIWIGTREGLSFYNQDLDVFDNYYYKKGGKNIAVSSIAPMSKDLLMLGTTEGIILFDIPGERFLNDTLSSAVHLLKPQTLIQQGDEIYIGTSRGVYTYHPGTNNLQRLLKLPDGLQIQAILCQMVNYLWIATEGDGLFLYNRKTNELKNYRSEDTTSGLNSNFVRSLALDLENRLWIGTYNGLNIYKEGEEKFFSIQNTELQQGSLSQNSVRSIFRDSQGGMWLGTYWGGLNYYHPLCNRFQDIKHVPFANSISNNVVNCIVEDSQDNLWIGTSDGGLNLYDSRSKRYKNYPFADNSHSFKDIKTVYVDEEQDKIYVGAHAAGIMVLNRKNGREEFFNRRNSDLPSNNIYSIISDDADGLWIASLEHLVHYDIAGRRFSVISKDVQGNPMQEHSRLLFRDSQKRLWIGGETGCSVYNTKGTLLYANHDFHIPDILAQSFINCFYESTSGSIWIGSRNGLFTLNPEKGKVTHYTTDNGLPSNTIQGILEDSYGRLWLSTNQGLSCFDPGSQKIHNYTISDGLQSNQFNAGSYCRTSGGSMLFGGINGITSFRPETLIDNPYSPKPVINKLFVYNKEVLPNDDTAILSQSIENTSSITLQSYQNSFALSFVVSNYIAGRHNTFSYMLKGYDNDWYTQKDNNLVTYSNLPAGDYTFILKSANNDGKWSDGEAILHIRILPVWYRTWWFITLLVFFLLLLASGAARYFYLRKKQAVQLKMQKLDKERQEEVTQMKIRFYIDISHELRTPLTLIVAPLQELIKHTTAHWEQEKLLYIQRNTNRLLHLVNQLMDYRRAELGIFQLKAGYGNAYQRVMNTFMNYESLAKRKEIDYNLYSELQNEDVLFDANYLDIIVNNLLSNAFKYTESGESITVSLYREGRDLVLQVSDTGVGIPPEKQKKIFERFYQVENTHEGSGIGLSLIQRLVELHHGRIDLQSQVDKGSTFSIYLPQDEEMYRPGELSEADDDSEDVRFYTTNAHDNYIGDEEIPKSEEPPVPVNGKRETILIAEDNEELRQYIVSGLSPEYNVLEAENGEVAWEMLKACKENDIDLVITDVMMPRLDGIQLCKSIKQNLKTCHIPVYMLSAKVDVKYQLEGLKIGATDYIAKPFSMIVLKTKIQNMLRMRYRMFERYSNTTEIEPEKITNNSMDEELIKRAIAIVERNMDNVEFSTEQFAREMNMSRSNLHLKLKAITGKSAIDFIHKIRFNRACQLLKEGKYTVSEISFMVGYNTPSYFALRFKKYMGCLPTEYGKK